jgi:hypothetical protein
MLLEQMYKNLDVLVNEDGTDAYFGIDDFNRLIVEEEVSLMVDAMNEEKKRPPTERPMTDALLQARTFTANNTGHAYDFPLPEGYLRMDSVVYINASGVKHSVDFMQASELIRRLGDMLAPPVEENYICYIEEGDELVPGRFLMFRPMFGVGTWGIFYQGRKTVYNGGWSVVNPFLDYYINTAGETVFLSENADMSLISTGTYRDGTAMSSKTGTAETQELYIPIEFHQRLLDRLIERLGLKDRDQMALGYGIAKDAQDAQKV